MSRKKTVVVMTCQDDPHVDFVLRQFATQGQRALFINPRRTIGVGEFTFNLTGSGCSGVLKSDTDSVPLEEIRSVWWRRPKASEQVYPAAITETELKYAKGEIKFALNGLWQALDCYWMSRPDLLQAASMKVDQLTKAAQFGLTVPKTLVTTNIGELRRFYEECRGAVIFKSLSTPLLGRTMEDSVSKLIFLKTTRLTAEMVEAHAETLFAAPCLFQEYVEKDVELRVTIIGEEIFAAEIDSQSNPLTAVDWRDYSVPMRMTKGSLPPDVAAKCLRFVKHYGLNFSAIDMIRRPDGEHVFIENNPNGQWLFVEHMVPEFKMTEALIACLVRGGS